MAWKPWYERAADFDTAQERTEFLKGVFGPPPVSNKKLAANALAALMIGWGVAGLAGSKKKKK